MHQHHEAPPVILDPYRIGLLASRKDLDSWSIDLEMPPLWGNRARENGLTSGFVGTIWSALPEKVPTTTRPAWISAGHASPPRRVRSRLPLSPM
jgi:hypothetical protein